MDVSMDISMDSSMDVSMDASMEYKIVTNLRRRSADKLMNLLWPVGGDKLPANPRNGYEIS